jgi:hypothetical protein
VTSLVSSYTFSLKFVGLQSSLEVNSKSDLLATLKFFESIFEEEAWEDTISDAYGGKNVSASVDLDFRSVRVGVGVEFSRCQTSGQ